MQAWRVMAVPPQQREGLARLWSRWVEQRQAMHDRMTALAHGLGRLPHKLDAPNHFFNSLFASCGTVAPAGDGDIDLTDAVATPPEGPAPHAWARALVGVCPRATAAAGGLLQQLRQAQVDAADATADTNCRIRHSSQGLTAQQMFDARAATYCGGALPWRSSPFPSPLAFFGALPSWHGLCLQVCIMFLQRGYV
jgi:hypothetical protein